MYDPNRESNPSLCEFVNNQLCYYISKSSTIQCLQKKSHHYQEQNHIVELIEHICRQLFYYSNSLQKISSKQEEVMVQNVLLQNVKRITIHNCDKYGLIPQQKLFYLAVSCLHSRHNGISNLREYLNEVHYLLTANAWANPNEQLPFALVMLVNGQFEQLLQYAKEELIFKSQSQQIQQLVDILVYKLQQQDNANTKYIINTSVGVVMQQINQSEWMKKLQQQMIKRRSSVISNVFAMFESRQEIQIVLAILAGNTIVIEQLCKGSWGLYLNIYINFIQKLSPKDSPQKSYETVVSSYIQNYPTNSTKPNRPSQQTEEFFLIKLLNTMVDGSRFSFHEIYQTSFNIFSPIISQLIGLLLLECRAVDLYSIVNNKEYYQEILLNLVESCNSVSWSAFVHVIGFVQNATYFKDYAGKETMWENFLLQHLPYQLQTDNQKNPLQNQVKEIQDKLQDLNIVGMSSFTKSYLNTLFTLQLNQSNSHNKLNQPILQIFFLTLEMGDSSNANACFHQMKSFMTQYYRNHYFNYQLLQDYLENIFERKQNILSQKMQNKIEKLFCLPYKIKKVYDIVLDQPWEGETKENHIKQLKLFNQLFLSTKNKKSISLSLSLLQLASYLHQAIENKFTLQPQPQMDLENTESPNQNQNQEQTHLVKQFQRNVSDYLQQWKIYLAENMEKQYVSENVFEELSYFDHYFY